jgi:hypothetical protein
MARCCKCKPDPASDFGEFAASVQPSTSSNVSSAIVSDDPLPIDPISDSGVAQKLFGFGSF